jgi:methionyl-tRNA synthetase
VAADLYAVLETSRWVALLLAPVLPELSARMLAQLGESPLHSSSAPAPGREPTAGEDGGASALPDGRNPAPDQPGRWLHAQRWALLREGTPLPEPVPVMQRLELDSPL